MEADATLINWFKALRVGGKLYLNLLDSDYYAQLWLNAQWDEKSLRDESSDARQAFAGLFGSQQGSNPKFDDYSTDYTHVHKSAYNRKRLTFLLERAGFVDVEMIADKEKLKAVASKSMNVGERQISTNYDNIRLDHKNRYQFACDQLQEESPNTVLDLACGIGYGTLMLANATNAKVTGVDIDQGAIDYANSYYSNSNTQFLREDARLLTLPDATFDAVVSFETIEHVEFDLELISKFYQLLKPGGRLICSTPNEDVMPYDPVNFKYHIKHYTNNELLALLKSAGFLNVELFAQHDPNTGDVVMGQDGSFIIAVATK
ncbi:tocopherol O-methyltransferase [Aliiglaciecola lipolytica E3]|uniref:Tocopherol O-methyltransferase n=2 Tax=Aliiglaciecola TaxID=1406885 RepID=K6YEZ4_9ALTE|nr:tocopherol O-methyltransferase [Aliiglaciecola lipolytica E3]